MDRWLLKAHRWIALVFALPLLIVIGTGLVLSFEPSLIVGAIKPGALSAARIESLLAQHDPGGQARGLVYRAYDQTLTIGGGRGGTVVDVVTGRAAEGPGGLASTLVTARRMHETLLIDAGWLVTASTVAMLALVVLGIVMGMPRRLPNSLSGWHKGLSWGLLPLIALSPLTGLMVAMGITFATPPTIEPGARTGGAMKLPEALRAIETQHDLSSLVWVRPQRGQLVARVVDGGEFRLLAVTHQGLTPLPRNWPRLWHEGNFAGHGSGLLNIATSLALVGLLGTGVWMWVSRQLRRRSRRGNRATAAA